MKGKKNSNSEIYAVRDEDWHKQKMMQLLQENLTIDQYCLSLSINTRLRYYAGTQDLSHLNYLAVATGGDGFAGSGSSGTNSKVGASYPATFDEGSGRAVFDNSKARSSKGFGRKIPARLMNINIIRTKIDVLMGMFLQRKMTNEIRAINEDANKYKENIKIRAKAEAMLRPAMEQLEIDTGVKMGLEEMIDSQNQFPSDMAGLEEYFKHHWQHEESLILQSALDAALKYFRYYEQRMKLFFFQVATGFSTARLIYENGEPFVKTIHPAQVIYDLSAEDDYLTDNVLSGSYHYPSLAETAERNGLSVSEMEDAYENQDDLTWSGISTQGNFTGAGNKVFTPFMDQKRVLEVHFEFDDWEECYKKVHKDENGGPDIVEVYYDPDDEEISEIKQQENVVKGYRQIWREVTFVGGDNMVKWGKIENRLYRPKEKYHSESHYTHYISGHFMNSITEDYGEPGSGKSITALMMSFQNLTNAFRQKIGMEIGKASGKGIQIDVSQWDPSFGTEAEDILYWIKGQGVTLYNGAENKGNDRKMIEEYDVGLSKTVGQYIELMKFFMELADESTGITKQMVGIVANPHTAVGVQQRSLNQGSLVLEPMFYGFLQFEERLLQKWLTALRILFARKPEFFQDQLTEFGIQDVEQLNIEGYEFVLEIMERNLDEAQLKQLIELAIQSKQLSFKDGGMLLLMLQRDPAKALRRYYQLASEQEAIEAQQQMMIQQQQMAQQAAGGEQANATRLQEVQMKEDGANQRAAMGVQMNDKINARNTAAQQEKLKKDMQIKLMEMLEKSKES